MIFDFNKKSKNKKGYLYTLSLSLFAIIFLTLILLFLRSSATLQSRSIELSFYQKNYDLDNSIQDIFVEAFTRESNINFSSDSSSLRLEEGLPNNFVGLNSLVSDLKAFVERDFNSIEVNLGIFLVNHNLILLPLNVTTLHNGNGIFIESNPDIISYNITLAFSENITFCDSEIEEDGAIDFNFLGNSSDRDCIISQNNAEEVEIDLIVNGEAVTIELDEDGELIIESNATVHSTVEIGFNEISSNSYFQLPIMVEINDSGFNFYKKSKIWFPILS